MTDHLPAGQMTHEVAIYGTDHELVAAAVPFLTENTTAEVVLILAAEPRTERVVMDHLPIQLPVVRMQGAYERPAAAIQQVLDLLSERAEGGSGRVRVVGEVPEDTRRGRWWPWARYEAAANTVYAGQPFSGLCLYDTRSTPATVLAGVHATHPTVVRDGRRRSNPARVDPDTFLRRPRVPAADALPDFSAVLELHDPTPAEVREALRRLTGADPHDHDPLAYGPSEAVTNAHQHGHPPVTVRVWEIGSDLVATVHDTGPGTQDPYSGLISAHSDDRPGGYGLWLTHQMCDEVVHYTDDTGFTIRITARRH